MQRRLFMTLGAAAVLAACTPGGGGNRQLVPRVVSVDAQRRGNIYFVTAVAEVDEGWTEIQLEGSGGNLRLTGVPPATPTGTTRQVTAGPTAVSQRQQDREGSREFTVAAAGNSRSATAY
ncbi:MAG: hypothetical protein RLO50_00170 [Azospirillaceae bacterium]